MTEFRLKNDPYPLLIRGQEVAAASGDTFETFDPSSGHPIATVYEAGEQEVDRAIEAAHSAFEAVWRKTTPKERSRLLFRLADAVRDRERQLAHVETLNVGRPISATRKEMAGVADSIEYYASVLLGLSGETLNISDPSLTDFTLREPLGVCGLIMPWNYPVLLATLKMAPALAAGNTVVLKPSEITPLSTAILGEACLEAGFPDGVVNIVHGRGDVVGMHLVRSGKVAKISFTGGTATGKRIYAESASTVKKLTLELGGKSPLIVFADSDLNAAIDAAFTDNTRNSGQVCAACSRILVEREVSEEFIDALSDRLRQVRIGPASDPQTEMGPLVSARHLERVAGYVDQANREGATVHTFADLSGRNDIAGGFFFPPTLLVDATNEMVCSQEEIFGPVQSVIPFNDESDAVRIANDSSYGLAAVVYTRDTGRAMRVAKALAAGTICINAVHKVSVDAPFGGYKQSGLGKERGIAAMLDDTQIKNIRYSMI